jgi:hypothetical protein
MWFCIKGIMMRLRPGLQALIREKERVHNLSAVIREKKRGHNLLAVLLNQAEPAVDDAIEEEVKEKISLERVVDPVVAQDGQTYDRETLSLAPRQSRYNEQGEQTSFIRLESLALDDRGIHVDNRNIATFLTSKRAIEAALAELKAARAETAAAATENESRVLNSSQDLRGMFEALICPHTKEIMQDPVVALNDHEARGISRGMSYERSVLAGLGFSELAYSERPEQLPEHTPETQRFLPNYMLKSLIARLQELQEQGQFLQPTEETEKALAAEAAASSDPTTGTNVFTERLAYLNAEIAVARVEAIAEQVQEACDAAEQCARSTLMAIGDYHRYGTDASAVQGEIEDNKKFYGLMINIANERQALLEAQVSLEMASGADVQADLLIQAQALRAAQLAYEHYQPKRRPYGAPRGSIVVKGLESLGNTIDFTKGVETLEKKHIVTLFAPGVFSYSEDHKARAQEACDASRQAIAKVDDIEAIKRDMKKRFEAEAEATEAVVAMAATPVADLRAFLLGKEQNQWTNSALIFLDQHGESRGPYNEERVLKSKNYLEFLKCLYGRKHADYTELLWILKLVPAYSSSTSSISQVADIRIFFNEIAGHSPQNRSNPQAVLDGALRARWLCDAFTPGVEYEQLYAPCKKQFNLFDRDRATSYDPEFALDGQVATTADMHEFFSYGVRRFYQEGIEQPFSSVRMSVQIASIEKLSSRKSNCAGPVTLEQVLALDRIEHRIKVFPKPDFIRAFNALGPIIMKNQDGLTIMIDILGASNPDDLIINLGALNQFLVYADKVGLPDIEKKKLLKDLSERLKRGDYVKEKVKAGGGGGAAAAAEAAPSETATPWPVFATFINDVNSAYADTFKDGLSNPQGVDFTVTQAARDAFAAAIKAGNPDYLRAFFRVSADVAAVAASAAAIHKVNVAETALSAVDERYRTFMDRLRQFSRTDMHPLEILSVESQAIATDMGEASAALSLAHSEAAEHKETLSNVNLDDLAQFLYTPKVQLADAPEGLPSASAGGAAAAAEAGGAVAPAQPQSKTFAAVYKAYVASRNSKQGMSHGDLRSYIQSILPAHSKYATPDAKETLDSLFKQRGRGPIEQLFNDANCYNAQAEAEAEAEAEAAGADETKGEDVQETKKEESPSIPLMDLYALSRVLALSAIQHAYEKGQPMVDHSMSVVSDVEEKKGKREQLAVFDKRQFEQLDTSSAKMHFLSSLLKEPFLPFSTAGDPAKKYFFSAFTEVDPDKKIIKAFLDYAKGAIEGASPEELNATVQNLHDKACKLYRLHNVLRPDFLSLKDPFGDDCLINRYAELEHRMRLNAKLDKSLKDKLESIFADISVIKHEDQCLHYGSFRFADTDDDQAGGYNRDDHAGKIEALFESFCEYWDTEDVGNYLDLLFIMSRFQGAAYYEKYTDDEKKFLFESMKAYRGGPWHTEGAAYYTKHSKKQIKQTFERTKAHRGDVDPDTVRNTLRKINCDAHRYTTLSSHMPDGVHTVCKIQNAFFAKVLTEEQKRSIPEAFICPITRKLMIDPVIGDDGYTYERAALEARFEQGNFDSPRVKGTLSNLYPNLDLSILMCQHLNDAFIAQRAWDADPLPIKGNTFKREEYDHLFHYAYGFTKSQPAEEYVEHFPNYTLREALKSIHGPGHEVAARPQAGGAQAGEDESKERDPSRGLGAGAGGGASFGSGR